MNTSLTIIVAFLVILGLFLANETGNKTAGAALRTIFTTIGAVIIIALAVSLFLKSQGFDVFSQTP